ncbi:MAG: ACT domain-containing protein [Patescibacteria group bacterium]|mgnify:FL=1
MLGINNLEVLLKSMQPELVSGEFVFCTSVEPIVVDFLLSFKENEGWTYILTRKKADELKLSYSTVWAMITLNVHSDLEAVGFLAALTPKLAAEGISVNVVSAFYHDHLFVPAAKKDQALAILKSVSEFTPGSEL